MTEIQAIIQLSFDMEMILFEPSTGEKMTLEQVKYINEHNYNSYIADEIAINALKKQIPVMIVGRSVIENAIGGYCPTCRGTVRIENTFLTRARGQCCSWCGQKLDW